MLSPDKIQQQLSHSLKAWTNVLSQEARDFICQYQMNNHSETISSLPVERIEHIVQAMWKTDSFHMNAAQFPSQLAALNDALLFSYAHCFPTIISLKNYRAKLSFLHTHIQNPLLEYYQERLIPQIKSFQPDLIGMSYSCSQ
ncbi:MAG: hypothetical protein GY801_49510 [bacterium]|nr:hypothetical protein [bacterium]